MATQPPEKKVGREPIMLVQIDQDFCENSYGVAPCTASGLSKCFNTRKTCQDPANFDKGVLTLSFAKPQLNLPSDFPIIPSLRDANTVATEINPQNGNQNSSPLGKRATASVTFQDHPHSDFLVDPYVTERPYNPFEQSTFWAKWLARNPYYHNRPIRIYDGYIGQAVEDMRVRHYIIDSITVPDSKGTVKVTAKDPLKLADKEQAQIPKASTGKLSADILSIVATSFTVDRALLADYDASGQVRIGNEIILYTSLTESGGILTFSGCTRGAYGSTAGTHKINAAVQKTLIYQDQTLWTGVRDLLVDWCNIDPQYIDDDEWEAENVQYLAQYNFTSVLSKPVSVISVLNQLTQQLPFYIYWDERNNKIQYKASRYYSGEFPLLTEQEILADSFSTSTNPKDRISQVWVYHTPQDWTKTETVNFQQLEVNANIEIEGPEFYDEQKIRIIESYWLTGAQAVNLGQRLLRFNSETPLYVKLSLDAKDAQLWVGDVVDVEHRSVVDEFGNRLVNRYLVHSATENISGTTYDYELIKVVSTAILTGFYMDASAPMWDDATSIEKETGAWFADNVGQLPTNVDGYQYE
jgi:hypothetical protein